MLLLNYKNDSSTNVFEYYVLAIYLANTKHLCRNGILQFLKTAEFLKNVWIYVGIFNLLIYDQKTVILERLSFRQSNLSQGPKIGPSNSGQQHHLSNRLDSSKKSSMRSQEAILINYMSFFGKRYNSTGFPLKANHCETIHRNTFHQQIEDIFIVFLQDIWHQPV